jgi:hypothetical protein
MLHPHFHRFVKLAIQSRLPVHIFSNFLIPRGVKGLESPPNAISFLVNVNDRDTYTEDEWNTLNDNLECAFKNQYRCVLAYTVHSVAFDISHIRSLALKYHVQKIRISPAKPMIGMKNSWINNKDIKLFSESAYGLYKDLASVGIQLVLDCPIPFCHIPPEYLAFFLSSLNLSGRCTFGVSVDTNLATGHCYITNSLLERRSLRSFKDIFELHDYLREMIIRIEEKCQLFSECKECSYNSQGLCSAGCYGLRFHSADPLMSSHDV